MKRDLLTVAVAGALAMPQFDLRRELVAPKMRDGERGIVGRRKQVAAYKRQRAADRARRRLVS